MDGTIDAWVRGAKQGDRDKLEKLIAGIQNRVYDLSLRMLMFAADAEDATQEILIKILTNLDDFRGESRFWTWAYRIAVNHLLVLKRYRTKRMGITFDFWQEDMKRTDPSFDYEALPEPSKTLLTEEVRIGCMQGMLQCLETKLRIAFILGDLLDEIGRVMVLFRSFPEYAAPDAVVEIVKRMIDSRQYAILRN